MKTLLGVVMCGGESRRMGTDKGLINTDGLSWAQRAFVKLEALHIPVKVSVNATQQENYGALFGAGLLVTDSLALQGPLNGILSVHEQHSGTSLLVLACDMIDMDSLTLQGLVDAYSSKPDYDYYSYYNGRFFEPLCAIYTSAALDGVKANFESGLLAQYSLQNILHTGKTWRLPVVSSSSFNNLNSI